MIKGLKKEIKGNDKDIPTIKVRRPRKNAPFNKERVYDMVANNQAKQDLLKAYANIDISDDFLLIQAVLPTKRTVLHKIVENFNTHTDIPILMPLQMAMCYLAGYLLEKGTVIKKDETQLLNIAIWVLILAPSGASKTFSMKIIEEAFGWKPNISPGIESDAAFIQEMADKGGKGSLFRDEFGQHFKSIQNSIGPYALYKDYYLKCYDGTDLERKTKKGTITVEKPQLNLMGMTVDSTFFDIMTFETFLDGIAQRINYVVAQKDPNKNIMDYLNIPRAKVLDGLKEYFDDIKNLTIHSEYVTQDENMAVEIITAHFRGIFSRFERIPESFIRRLFIATYKYATLYHILLNKNNDYLDDEDFNYACKYMTIHIKSLKTLIEGLGFTEIEEDFETLDKAQKKLSATGKKVTVASITRYLQQNHRTRFRNAEKTRKFVQTYLSV